MSRLPWAAILACLAACSGISETPEQPQTVFGDGIDKCTVRSLDKLLFGEFANQPGYENTISFVGFLKSGAKIYSIYSYDVVRLQNMRETSRIIVMRKNCMYIGHYVVSALPIRISGEYIVFKSIFPPYGESVMHFENGKPPTRAIVDGDIADFSH